MVLKFEIIKLLDHHNRGQVIVARQLNFKETIQVQEGALLNGIEVYHYKEMYPISYESEIPQFNIYVFRPPLKRFPEGHFQVGQIVELINPDFISIMSANTFQNQIQEAIPRLLDLARGLTWNNISVNCKFILTEIKDSSANFHEMRKLNKKLNDKKVPTTLEELMPALLSLYDNFYDINLRIYRAKKDITIIDFRYYPKSSLVENFRATVLDMPPMLHCKVSTPPWQSDKKEKFDVNWEHFEGLNRLRLFWLKVKLKIQNRFSRL